MARERKKREEKQGGAPEWMVTYGDMMGLLLCFFVLLLSFSTISEKEFKTAMVSLQGALGVFKHNQAIVPIDLMSRSGEKGRQRIKSLAVKLKEQLQVAGKASDIKVELNEQGELKISFPEGVLFDTARAELRNDAYPVLTKVGGLIRELPDALYEVRGHTDNRPLKTTTQYRDNHELSYFRADAVARFLSRTSEIALDSFETVACGAGQPVATNDTEEGLQANRRVELYVRASLTDEEKARIAATGNTSGIQETQEAAAQPPER